MVENVQNRIKILPVVHSPSHAPVPLSQLQSHVGVGGKSSAFSKLTFHRSDTNEPERRCEVVFLQSAYQTVIDHLAHDTTREHGGFLLGYESSLESGKPAMVIVDAVAGRHTEGTPVRLTFTNDTWRDLDDEILRRYPDGERVPQRVGWYHSHPNITIFLSQYDLDVCKTFDRRRYPVALVVDPIKHRGGFFIGEGKGYQPHSPQGFYEAHDLADESVVTWGKQLGEESASTPSTEEKPLRVEGKSQDESKVVQQDQKPRRRSQGQEAVLAVTLVLMAVAIGYLFIKQRNDIKSLQQQISELKTKVAPVIITPKEIGLSASESVQFRADVGEGVDKTIAWTRTPKVGTISSEGLYTAPERIDSESEVIVEGQSAADQTKVGIAHIRLLPPKPAIAVKVTPKTSQLKPSQTQQFKAQVLNLTGELNPGVKWTISPNQGTVTDDGSYTAPSAVSEKTTVTVSATSLADDTKSASATISLVPETPAKNRSNARSTTDAPQKPSPSSPPASSPPSSSPPSAGSLEIVADKSELMPGESVKLTASFADKTEAEVKWSIEPAGAGSISESGEYKAPKPFDPKNSRVLVIATSLKDTSRTGKKEIKLKAEDQPAAVATPD